MKRFVYLFDNDVSYLIQGISLPSTFTIVVLKDPVETLGSFAGDSEHPVKLIRHSTRAVINFFFMPQYYRT